MNKLADGYAGKIKGEIEKDYCSNDDPGTERSDYEENQVEIRNKRILAMHAMEVQNSIF